MFWKDRLAKMILAEADVSLQWLLDRQSEFTSLRVKTVDAKGKVPVIQFAGKGEWFKPKEWAHNHLTNLKQHHEELRSRLIELGCDPTETRHPSSVPASKEYASQNDLLELQKLRDEAAIYRATAVNFYGELQAVASGRSLSLEMRNYLAECKAANRIKWIELNR